MSNERKILTAEQTAIVAEYVEMHNLDASQISFEGKEIKPIFDYEAVCALSLKLTDIQDISCEISERDFEYRVVSAKCVVTLPDGRTRTSEDSAAIGDVIGDGKTIETMRLAENVAQARAVRRGIRSVGINLANAHTNFKLNLSISKGSTDYDPRQTQYNEIHLYAEKAGFIVGKDKSEYQMFIAEQFDGRASAKDLNDLELQRLLVAMRSFARLSKKAA